MDGIKKSYTSKDYFSVLKGFEKGENDEEFYRSLEEQWNDIDTSQSSEFRQNQVWSVLKQQLFVQRPILKLYHTIRNIAAILFIPLLLGTGILYYLSNSPSSSKAWGEIKCPAGVRTEFQLPDGTSGFLNNKSKLRYPVQFDKVREVELEGEAYFDVVKQNGKKFRVNTSSIKVEVLGTSFNVSAYHDNNDEVVTLKNGKVRVLGKNDEQLTELSPDQQFTLNKDINKFSVTKVTALNYTSWISGKMLIQNETFEEIAKRLSRWYDVEIEIEGQKLKKFRYYATFEDEPLDEVLRLIALTAPIQYKDLGRIKNDNGTFSRRKIKFIFDENRINRFK